MSNHPGRINLYIRARENLHYRGRRLVTETSQSGDLVEREGENVERDGEHSHISAGENDSSQRLDKELAPENDDPLRRRFVIPRRALWLIRFVRKLFARPELTPDEKAQKLEAERAKAKEKVYMAELRDAEKMIIGTLTRRGIVYRKEKDGRIVREKRVRISNSYMSPDGSTAYFHIEPGDMPFGHGPEELIQQGCVDDVSWSLGKRTRVSFGDAVHGTVYIVERAASAGIPDTVDYLEMLERMPVSLPPLSVMLGKSIGGKPQYRNLAPMPHFLVAGESGCGKSTFLNGMICTLIRRNPPERLRLWMIDLKGGVEFGPYEGVPHLLPLPECPSGIARTPAAAVAILKAAIAEGFRRLKIYDDENEKRARKNQDPIRNMDDWNKHHQKNRLPHIVLFVDELALLAKAEKDAYQDIDTIAATLRSAGIHLGIATQTADRETIGKSTIKTNFPGRFCFGVPDHYQSILMVNTDDALNLGPVGRYIYKNGMEKFQVQAPYCSSSVVRQIIQDAKEGKQDTKIENDVTVEPVEIITWALDKSNGVLDKRSVFNQFKSRGITRLKIEKLLREMDEKVYEVEYTKYKIIPGDGSRARRVEKFQEPVQTVG